MANDTDLLTSDDSDVSTVCRKGEIGGRQNSLVSLNMSSEGQDTATLRSTSACDEKLDSYRANGCVKMREGTSECPGVVEPVVCRNAPTTRDSDEVLKFTENAAFVDNQHSTANGLVPSHAVKLTDSAIHSQQSSELCQNYPPAAVSETFSEVSHKLLSTGSTEKLDLDNAEKHPNGTELSDCACSLHPAALASDLSSLSIADEDRGNTTVPCDTYVATQLDSKLSKIRYIVYESERQMEAIMQLITRDLSEPYSIYTYRYFIHNWPKLCFLVCICEVVCFCVTFVHFV